MSGFTYSLRPCFRLGNLLQRAHPRRVHARYSRACSALAAPERYETLPDAQRQQVDVYLDTLFDWNQRMNLTGKACLCARHLAKEGSCRRG